METEKKFLFSIFIALDLYVVIYFVLGIFTTEQLLRNMITVPILMLASVVLFNSRSKFINPYFKIKNKAVFVVTILLNIILTIILIKSICL